MVRVGEEIKESEGVKRKGRGYIRCGRCRLHQLHHYLLLFSDPLWDFLSLFLADFLMFFWDLISFDTWGFFFVWQRNFKSKNEILQDLFPRSLLDLLM